MYVYATLEPPVTRVVHAGGAATDLATKESKDPYEAALTAYALALAQLPEAGPAIDHLLNLATDNSLGLYWQLTTAKGSNFCFIVVSYIFYINVIFFSPPTTRGQWMDYWCIGFS